MRILNERRKLMSKEKIRAQLDKILDSPFGNIFIIQDFHTKLSKGKYVRDLHHPPRIHSEIV